MLLARAVDLIEAQVTNRYFGQETDSKLVRGSHHQANQPGMRAFSGGKS
jgi:hypothetical protein